MTIVTALALIAAAAAPIIWIGTRKSLELTPTTREPSGKMPLAPTKGELLSERIANSAKATPTVTVSADAQQSVPLLPGSKRRQRRSRFAQPANRRDNNP